MSGSGEQEQPENHFHWDLESLTNWKDVIEYLEDNRRKFNYLRPHKMLKRYRIGMFMSYIMFKHDLEGWLNCLDNAILIMEHTRHPTALKPLMNIPRFDSPLWKGPFEKFISYLPDSEASSDHDLEQVGVDVEKQEEQWNSFEGLYVPAEHIAFSLKATMLTKMEASKSAENLWGKIVPIDKMSDAEKAGICYIKAATFRLCGTQGVAEAINPLKKAVLLDPDKLLWTLKLILYKGMVRRVHGGGKTKWPEVAEIIAVADSVLKLELEDWMRVKFQYEKFQALQDFFKDPQNRSTFPTSKKFELFKECMKLCDAVVARTKESNMLARCAMFYARDEIGIAQAVDIIEDVLKNDPFNTYVNSNAVAIYKRANQMDKALNCAKLAAEASVGSYMQLLELQTKLGHSIDLEEFFQTGLNKYQQMTEVRTIHTNAFIYYTSLTNHFKRAIWHFKKVLDSGLPEAWYRFYNVWINSMIHIGESAYNVVLYVMSGDKTYSDDEYSEDNDRMLFTEVKEAIEELFDVASFGSSGSWLEDGLNPKEYLEWFKTKRDAKFQKRRYTENHSHPQNPELQEWQRQTNDSAPENVIKQRTNWFGNSAGSFANKENRRETQTACNFGHVTSQSQANTQREYSTPRYWRSRPSTSNTGYPNSNNTNSRPRNLDDWRSRDGNTGASRYKSYQSNWRTRDNTHDS